MTDKKQTCYLAGPMSGYPDFNFPAFFDAAADLEAAGWTVFNPANKEDEEFLKSGNSFATGDHKIAAKEGFDFKAAYTWDVCKVIEADAIYMLKGWEKSVGATGELAVAMAVQKHVPEYKIIFEEEVGKCEVNLNEMQSAA